MKMRKKASPAAEKACVNGHGHTRECLKWKEEKELAEYKNKNIDRSQVILKKQLQGLPWWSSGKESPLQCRGHGFHPWSGN